MSIYKKSVKLDTPKTTRDASSRQEKEVAKRVGGKQTANSGATTWSKGDVSSNKILYECKTKMTDSESISIKKEWFEKNKQEMVFMGKDYSVIVFNFGPNQPNYYILDELTYQDFLEYLEEKNHD